MFLKKELIANGEKFILTQFQNRTMNKIKKKIVKMDYSLLIMGVLINGLDNLIIVFLFLRNLVENI